MPDLRRVYDDHGRAVGHIDPITARDARARLRDKLRGFVRNGAWPVSDPARYRAAFVDDDREAEYLELERTYWDRERARLAARGEG